MILLGSFCLFNAAVFAVYRTVFLQWFSGDAASALKVQALLRGLRLDAALLSSELFIVGAIFLAARSLKPSRLSVTLCMITLFNVLISIGNLFVFHERNQQVGDLLMGYITSPRQVYLAAMPFITDHYLLFAGLLTASAAFAYAGIIYSRRLDPAAMDSWKPWRRLPVFLLLLGLAALPALEPVKVKKTRSAKGWKLQFCLSKYYAVMNSMVLNQAVINPVQELLWVYLPAEFSGKVRYQLEEKKALEITRSLLGISGSREDYPLLADLKGTAGRGIESVVIIQVEGLSQFLVDHMEDGKYVMPFLHRLSRENIYFPNTYQGFNATAGGVFAAVTGFHKDSFNEQTMRFTTSELSGHYGSLPHILAGRNMRHYFFLGFVHSSADFTAFMQNQGYFVHDYDSIKKHSEGRWPAGETENALGLYDKFYLSTAADMLVNSHGPFTAHLMTSTTHSPWSVPESFPGDFSSPVMNAFAYADASIKAFFERLRAGRPDFDRILVVILADHASIAGEYNDTDRRRIPLLFCNPAFRGAGLNKQYPAPAGQIDVLPTVLSLLGRETRYAGFGRDLLDSSISGRGIVSGGRHEAVYIKDGLMLEYKPLERSVRLLSMSADGSDVSAAKPELLDKMKEEYIALTETARRISASKKIFPLSEGR